MGSGIWQFILVVFVQLQTMWTKNMHQNKSDKKKIGTLGMVRNGKLFKEDFVVEVSYLILYPILGT